MNETAQLKIREEILLRKYDGDPPAEGEEKEPLEVLKIVAENGEIVSVEKVK